MENPEIGGIPIGIWLMKRFLPKGAKRRDVLGKMSILLTYVTYLVFCAGRKPITIVQMKIIQECNVSFVPKLGSEDNWCEGSIFQKNSQQVVTQLSTFYMGAYAICLYISGCIADYFNPRYYVATGCLFGGFFSITLGLANIWKIKSVDYFTMALILFAAAQATAWPVMLATVTHWYSGVRMALFFAVWNTHSYVGSLLGTYMAGIYVDNNWGWSFFLPGFLLILMSLFIFVFLVAHPSDLKHFDDPRKSIFENSEEEVMPTWLDSWRTIDYYQAFQVPGVIEFSGSMFFSRMVSYIFLFWLPYFLNKESNLMTSSIAYMNIPYIVGGIVGGVLAGIMKDLYNRSAVVCIVLIAFSIIAIALQMVAVHFMNVYLTAVFQVVAGIFVEGPYVLLSTAISADLGSHSLIRRGHRGLATVASIVEGTGALGSTMGPYAVGYLFQNQHWNYSLLLMMCMELLSSLCLIRMARNELKKPLKRLTLAKYWQSD